MDLTPVVARCLEVTGVRDSPDAYVALLRTHVSGTIISQHVASHARTKLRDRATSAEARERFDKSHAQLRADGAPELEKLTFFLQRVADERAIVEMLHSGGQTTDSAEDRSSAACTGSLKSTPLLLTVRLTLAPATPLGLRQVREVGEE